MGDWPAHYAAVYGDLLVARIELVLRIDEDVERDPGVVEREAR